MENLEPIFYQEPIIFENLELPEKDLIEIYKKIIIDIDYLLDNVDLFN